MPEEEKRIQIKHDIDEHGFHYFTPDGRLDAYEILKPGDRLRCKIHHHLPNGTTRMENQLFRVEEKNGITLKCVPIKDRIVNGRINK